MTRVSVYRGSLGQLAVGHKSVPMDKLMDAWTKLVAQDSLQVFTHKITAWQNLCKMSSIKGFAAI